MTDCGFEYEVVFISQTRDITSNTRKYHEFSRKFYTITIFEKLGSHIFFLFLLKVELIISDILAQGWAVKGRYFEILNIWPRKLADLTTADGQNYRGR